MQNAYTLTPQWIGDIPCLVIARDELAADAPLALVLHGLGGRKEKMLSALYELARLGFRAVALDVRGHGERLDAADLETRLQADYLTVMGSIIEGTASDIPRLLDHFAPSHAAIHGISLGGYITFAALLAEPRLSVASVAMGSPDWTSPLKRLGVGPGQAAYDRVAALNPLDLSPALLPPRPLLMLHGGLDEVVSPEGVVTLTERLQPLYAPYPDRLELRLYPDLGHHYTDDMLQRTCAWFTRFLS